MTVIGNRQRDLAATAQAEIDRLNRVVAALLDKAERDANAPASTFALFQRTLILEGQVSRRTQELEDALRENNRIIRKLEDAHGQMLQSEKLASIGQLAAGVAHEINNPIAFVSANLNTLIDYIATLTATLAAYERECPAAATGDAAPGSVASFYRSGDLASVTADIGDLISESIDGVDRVQGIVRSLRDFARADDKKWAEADIHSGIDSTINVVASELKLKAELVREYGELPAVECAIAKLNQVFLNMLMNAAQAIDGYGRITIRTATVGESVEIAISDTGTGIPQDVMARIFDPFYTTKPVGAGTGLGLALSYGIIEEHGGRIDVASEVGTGTTFTITIPVRRDASAPPAIVREDPSAR